MLLWVSDGYADDELVWYHLHVAEWYGYHYCCVLTETCTAEVWNLYVWNLACLKILAKTSCPGSMQDVFKCLDALSFCFLFYCCSRCFAWASLMWLKVGGLAIGTVYWYPCWKIKFPDAWLVAMCGVDRDDANSLLSAVSLFWCS